MHSKKNYGVVAALFSFENREDAVLDTNNKYVIKAVGRQRYECGDQNASRMGGWLTRRPVKRASTVPQSFSSWINLNADYMHHIGRK